MLYQLRDDKGNVLAEGRFETATEASIWFQQWMQEQFGV